MFIRTSAVKKIEHIERSEQHDQDVSQLGGVVIEDLHAGNWTPLCILNPISVGAAAPSQDISLKIILEEEKFK